MTPKETAALLALSASTWPWQKIDQAQAQVWANSLATMDPDVALEAMQHCVRRDETPPTIARLRSIAAAVERSRYPGFVGELEPVKAEPEVVVSEIAKAREHLAAAKARQSKNKGAAKGEGQ